MSSLRSQQGKAFRRLSCLQAALDDSGCGVPGPEHQAVYKLDHQAACRGGWRKSGALYLAERGVLPCRVGFSSRPLPSILMCLSPIRHRGARGRGHQLRGSRCVLKLQKSVSLKRNLRFLSYMVRFYGLCSFMNYPHEKRIEESVYPGPNIS